MRLGEPQPSSFRKPVTRAQGYALFLLTCLLIGAVIVIGSLARSRTDHNAHLISNNEFSSCTAISRLQVAANKSHYADWIVFTTVLDQAKASQQQQQQQTQQQRAYAKVFLDRLRGAVAEKSWVPIVDCVAQQRLDGRFVAPAPILFNKHLPPPSALRLP